VNEKPKVSVIIPTYNRAELLPRAIQSVLNQTFQDFEIIVVDDSSTDNTEEVIKEFQEQDKRIKYIKHDKNKGGSAARNTGIKVAQGEYIAFQDSDDEWLPEKLEKQMKVLENASSKVGVVYTGFWKIKDNNRVYIPNMDIACKEWNIRRQILQGNFIGTPTAIVNRVCFVKMGLFDVALPRLQDWELWIRFSEFYEFKFINEPLVTAHYTPDSISANQDALTKALTLILEKHYEDFKKDGRILAKHQYSIGNLLCQNGEMGQGREYLSKAIRVYPLNIKCWAAIFVSLFGRSTYNKVVKLKRRVEFW